jgi:hypothetical protein
MAFIIGGHPRSGTTLLFRLCRDHPQIGITGEFKSFLKLDTPYAEYVQSIERDWRHVSFIRWTGRRSPMIYKVASGVFLAWYGMLIRKNASNTVGSPDVERALKTIFRKRLVGDKYPGYIFALPDLVRQPNLRRIIIYRDARDVVSSFMKMVRTRWRDLPWVSKYKTAGDVATQWVHAIDEMETYRSSLFLLRYEEFVRDPKQFLPQLADYLEVRLEGFSAKKVHDLSIGKYAKYLSDEEIGQVMDIAGPKMKSLGYL